MRIKLNTCVASYWQHICECETISPFELVCLKHASQMESWFEGKKHEGQGDNTVQATALTESWILLSIKSFCKEHLLMLFSSNIKNDFIIWNIKGWQKSKKTKEICREANTFYTELYTCSVSLTVEINATIINKPRQN